MKKRLFSLLTFIVIGTAAFAQNPWVYDSVSMGPGSANDVYYSLNTGTVKIENNLNWHLAFSMNAGDSSAIWANHNAGNGYTKVFNIHKDKSQWLSVTIADTFGVPFCYNGDQKWSQGALNDVPSPSPYHFGWGAYDMVTHNVYGDSIFIVKTPGAAYKIIIDSLQSTAMTYYFTISDLSGPTQNSYVLAKAPKYANANFAYFDFLSLADSMREPDVATWDFVFNRYNSFILMGPPPAVPYSVIGALGNRGITFGKAMVVHVDTACNNYPTYTTPWSTSISTIGYDWKTFVQPAGPWIVPDSISYFILDKTSKIYQLQFTGYSGSGTGNINFRKRIVTPVKVNDISSIVNQYSISPVPASSQLTLMLDMKESGKAQILLSDMNGKVIYKSNLGMQTGLNAFVIPVQEIANGNYVLSLHGTNIDLKEKISILK